MARLTEKERKEFIQVAKQPAMREWGAGAELPGTDEAARTHMALPMSPVLSRAEAEEVVAAVGTLVPAR